MEEFLRQNVKTVIGRFPETGRILEEYGIGCVPCSVGTCLLSDVVEIHALPPEEEEELLGRIAAAVDPGRAGGPVRIAPRKAREPRKLAGSPPMKALVDEHVLIKRWIALIPAFTEILDVETEEGRRAVLEGVDFIRSYADRLHHAKEEDLLFALFDEGLDILKAMREDHVRGRGHVRGVIQALERRDKEGVAAHLAGYAAVLTEHIKKEDEILYPWMDRNLSTSQVGTLYARFAEVDERFAEIRERSAGFIERMEETLSGGNDNICAEVKR